MSMKRLADLRAVVFDTFGTLVDWRSSIIGELEGFGQSRGITADWTAIADKWRARYVPNMNRVRTGELPWMKLDALHRMALDDLLEEFGLGNVEEAERAHLTRAWHRLKPWPDTVPAMRRLSPCFILGPLSNGNVALLTNLARHSGLPFDLILSAELCRHYKPDSETYQMVCELLSLRPDQVMLVAAHNDDLHAAQQQGLRTGFVARPTEYGPQQTNDLRPEHEFDVTGNDLGSVADELLGVSEASPTRSIS